MRGLIIVIKGAGEMASGIAYRLHSAGLTRILMTDIQEPLAVRRTVSFCEAVYEGKAEVEGIRPFFFRMWPKQIACGSNEESPSSLTLREPRPRRSVPMS